MSGASRDVSSYVPVMVERCILPITAANIQFQDYQFSFQDVTGTWRWTTRMDVSGSNPTFEIRSVFTPFGTLRDNTPIPGEVVLCMAEGITSLQSNFPPSILLGPPASLVFDVDEGRGFTVPMAVTLTNDGVFGSLLGATLSTSASYVTVSPALVGNLSANEGGSFDVAVDSTTLLAANSPYAEAIMVQDANASNSPQAYSVTINVRPKAIISATPITLGFSTTKPITGPFPTIPSQTFDLQNTGPADSILEWQAQKLTNLSDNWLSVFGPVSGSLASGATETITVAPSPIEGLGVGTYQETIRVSGYSTNEFVDVLIQLVIS